MKSEYRPLRMGVMGIGLAAYWAQFEGLQSRLAGYVSQLEARISANERQVVTLGLVDSPERALEAGHACRK